MNPTTDFDVTFEYQDYAIGGKMISGVASVPETLLMQAKNDKDVYEHIRTTLVTKLVESMLKNKLVEINQMKDPITYDTKLYVRAYLAPDDQVKILRTVKR